MISSTSGCRTAGTRWGSGRTSWTSTDSKLDTRALADSFTAGKSKPAARVVIETAPGEEAQVDYGFGPMVRDAQTGKYRRTRLFVLTLGYSRKAVRLLTFALACASGLSCTRRLFAAWAAQPRLSFSTTCVKTFSPQMCMIRRSTHFIETCCDITARSRCPAEFAILTARVKSNRRIRCHTKKTTLMRSRFESLEEAQAYLDRWEERWADTRIHGTTKRQVSAMFAEEKPALIPLPLEPFRYYEYGERSIHLDGCVEVEAAYYSAPPGWISRRVHVQWNNVHVRLIDPRNGQLLREHSRQQRGRHRI